MRIKTLFAIVLIFLFCISQAQAKNAEPIQVAGLFEAMAQDLDLPNAAGSGGCGGNVCIVNATCSSGGKTGVCNTHQIDTEIKCECFMKPEENCGGASSCKTHDECGSGKMCVADEFGICSCEKKPTATCGNGIVEYGESCEEDKHCSGTKTCVDCKCKTLSLSLILLLALPLLFRRRLRQHA